MNNVSRGFRIVEGAAFVAAPLCAMTLAQQGADLIRLDPIDGGLDARYVCVAASTERQVQEPCKSTVQGEQMAMLDPLPSEHTDRQIGKPREQKLIAGPTDLR